MRKEPPTEELRRLRDENLDLRRRAVQLVDPERIVSWLRDADRMPAISAFSAGPERDLAREIELALARASRKHDQPA